MWLRRPPTRLQLEVRVPPAEVEHRLRSVTAEVRSFLLSPTWGRSEELVGQVSLPAFKLRVRHGYSNGLTRLLYGKVTPLSSGSRIEGEFRTLLWVVLVLRAVWVLILSGVALYLHQAWRYARPEGALVALSGPLLTWAFVVGIETIARRMGDGDEETMRSRLKKLFADVSAGRGGNG